MKMNLYYKLDNHYETVDQVYFRRPNRLGCYVVKKGLNGEKKVVSNVEDFYVKYSLKQFFKYKKLDLKDGFDERPDDQIFDSNGNIDELLQWILLNRSLFLLKNENILSGKMRCLNTDFVSFRGTLSLLLGISYDHKSQFTIHVEKFKDTHYMMLEKLNDDTQNPLFSYAGRRFELYCCESFSEEDKLKMNPMRAKSSDEKSSINEATSEFERHSTNDLCFIYRSRIDQHSLVYGAEMDCFENVVKLNGVIDSDLIKGVELKTCKHIEDNPRLESNFKKFKTMKWYNQSILSNVNKISCGFWRDDHIVDEIKEFSLADLVKIGTFDKKLCLVQFNKILTFIKSCFIKHRTNLLKFNHLSFSYKLVCETENVKTVLPDFYKNEFI